MPFDAIDLDADAAMGGPMSTPDRASMVSLVRRRGRNAEFDGQCRDFAAVFERCRVGKIMFDRDVMQHQAIGQTSQHSALLRFQAAGQCGNDVVGAHHIQ